MFTIQMFPNAFQRAICLFLSVIIVTASLALGASYATAHDRYSVTVTQIS